jgi:hypothetical protein
MLTHLSPLDEGRRAIRTQWLRLRWVSTQNHYHPGRLLTLSSIYSGGKYEAAPGVQIQQPPPNVSASIMSIAAEKLTQTCCLFFSMEPLVEKRVRFCIVDGLNCILKEEMQ